MNTQRRSFLAGILAIGAAPAIVKAESIMKIWVPPALPNYQNHVFVLHPSAGSVGWNLTTGKSLYDFQMDVLKKMKEMTQMNKTFLDWEPQSGKGAWRPGSYEQVIGRRHRENGKIIKNPATVRYSK